MSYAENITKCPGEVAISGIWIHLLPPGGVGNLEPVCSAHLIRGILMHPETSLPLQMYITIATLVSLVVLLHYEIDTFQYISLSRLHHVLYNCLMIS